MSGSSSAVTAIVERMMEKLQKENPDVEYKRKPPREKKPKAHKVKAGKKVLH